MRVQVRLLLVLALTCTGAGCAAGGEFPADVKAALAKADEWELYSLDPSREKEPARDNFHGWKILGKTTVKDADTRKHLVARLEQGAKENKGVVAGCFNPRHGVRVKSGDKTIDVVICFECYSASIFTGDEKTGSYLTTESPQPALDKVLTEAKVPLPTKAKDR